ncbi:MAG: fluoroquinolone transporter permease, partial [Stackebrandtia sp.]
LIFGDLAIVGFFFIVGGVFFERGERTLFATLTTPLRFDAYLASKLATLTLLSVVMTMIIVFSGVGLDFHPAPLLAGVVLCTLTFLLAGFISATPFASISEWVIPSTAVIGALNVSLVHYSGLWEHPVLYAVPTLGSILLFGAAFDRVALETWQVVYALVYQAAWIAVLWAGARKAFRRYLIQSEGGE